MQIQSDGRSTNPQSSPTYGYTRRIPRGKTGGSDPITRLWRMAEAHQKRIRGMQTSVTSKEAREALKAERRRLVEILNLAPWAMPTGSQKIIEDAMTEARRIYVEAEKATRHPRRHERSSKAKGVRTKSITRVAEESEALITLPTARRTDPKAEAFMDSLYDPANESLVYAEPEVVYSK